MANARKNLRNREIIELKSQGFSIKEIAKTYDISTSRTRRICHKYEIYEGKIMRRSEAFLSNAFKHMKELQEDELDLGGTTKQERESLIRKKLDSIIDNLGEYEVALGENH